MSIRRLNVCVQKYKICTQVSSRSLHYIQGQAPEPNIREYFYYIDHQGQVNIILKKIAVKCFNRR